MRSRKASSSLVHPPPAWPSFLTPGLSLVSCYPAGTPAKSTCSLHVKGGGSVEAVLYVSEVADRRRWQCLLRVAGETIVNLHRDL